jgi:chondroitin 4-sulfotransferase 11
MIYFKDNPVISLKRKINIYRRAALWRKAGLIFVHVPKAAGTSVNIALYGRPMGHYSVMEIKRTFPRMCKSVPVFSLVRNPWSRTYSAWKFAKAGATDIMGIHNPEQYRVSSFNCFESFLKEWLVGKDLNRLDFVFKPQTDFLCDERGNIMVDFLGKVENMSEVNDYVSNIVGRPVIIGKKNSTAIEDDYRKYYKDSEMVDIVYNLYKEDFHNFGYKCEI